MNEIRRRARQQRAEIGLEQDMPTPAEAVISACLSAAGLERHFVKPDDDMLAGAMAVLDLSLNIIVQDETRPLPEQHFDAAHELAHAWLHRDTAHGEPPRCVPPDLNPNETEEAPGSARSKVDGYSPRQRRENEANVFAAELLLPGSLARTLFLDEKMSSEAIAEALGLPGSVVQKQLADSLLLPQTPELPAKTSETPAAAAVLLDSWQQDAAETACGPLLVGAGPGTGKTKTLVGRCQFLTQMLGVPAKNILALTFSRKAATEMKERLLASGVGTENAGPWVGTFHAFGLEVLHRFGERLGLTGEIKLLDQLDAVTLLENHLPELQLDVLDNLYNPATHLGGILRQIGRAKDERCGPKRYAELCQAMLAAALADADALASRPGKTLKREQEAVAKGLENAQKAGEVARCYAVYERLTAEQGFLDFGDLIRRTTELLEAHPDVLAILQSEYPQVLADEYQDVNRACAYLVKLLAGTQARGLWAVGDHRQSIYQFQGASPANVAAFERDYPSGKRLELGVNYRSRRPIVTLFGGAASASESNLNGWHSHRGDAEAASYPAVTLARAPDAAGQAQGIAGAVKHLREQGWEHPQQAILCRTHSQASELAERLTALDVPVLYLGALLERPEVKDLLCLLSLLADAGGSALVRVASWPEYGVPLEKSLALLAQIRQEETRLLDALQEALHPGLVRLGRHLAELETMEDDPAALLRHYLFGLSEYLRGLIQRETKPFVQTGCCLAIHQLLGLAAGFDRRLVSPSFSGGPPSKIRDFLAHLRRLSSAGASPRGVLPPEAEALDAVRLLTAHAAKGLEFPVVFVPNLGAGQFPARGRHDGIPEPPGLTECAGEALDEVLDEERCLFFVALSRARDHLILSRAETTGSEKAIKPSPLLAHLEDALAALAIPETPWPAGGEATPEEAAAPDASLPEPLPEFSQSALETYGRCPRQYYYAQVLKLSGAFLGGGYPQFLSCVRQTLSWREDREARGETVTDAAVGEKLDALWAEHGPVGHLHEAKYKASAVSMLAQAALLGTDTERRADTRTLKATLSNCRVSVRPDVVRFDAADGAVVVARRMTGRPGHDDHTDKKLALYRRAAAETHPGKPVRVALHYLADGVRVPVDAPETKQQWGWEAGRIAKYESAARGIQLGLFPAETGDECARCPYHLLCPL